MLSDGGFLVADVVQWGAEMGGEPMKGERQRRQLDEITAYIESLDADERSDLAAASAAIDLGILLYRSRTRRGLSQAAAARLAGLQQQAVSRLERPDIQPRLETIQSYLSALGYALELSVIDLESGETTATAVLPPRTAVAVQRRAAATNHRP